MGQLYYRMNESHSVTLKQCNNQVHTYRAHFHDTLSIGFIRQGDCIAHIGETRFLSSGTLIVIPPGMIHWCCALNYHNWNFQMIYLDRQFLKNISGSGFQRIITVTQKRQTIRLKLASLFQELDRDIANKESVTEKIRMLFDFIELNGIQHDWPSSTDDLPMNLLHIKKFIEFNYSNPVSINDLADLSRMNKYALIRQFHAAFGMTPSKYLVNLRVNHAKKMLQHDQNIADIAVSSGFYDQSHFGKTFKAYTGVTPAAFRRSL